MARPIKETPILYGEDARRFENELNNVQPLSKEEKERIRTHYEEVLLMMDRGKDLSFPKEND
ncbi:MAG: hypothetical protein IKP81_02240 [Paludibacteraceae bacterium]|nr:hypothetical protein [Paludibacteraceae bacterium]MBR6103861.1 hypothetical protein [Paludibacteraceae bacterium]